MMELVSSTSREVSKEKIEELLNLESTFSYTLQDLGEAYHVTFRKQSEENDPNPLKERLELLERENIDGRTYIPLRLFYKYASRHAIRNSIDIPDIAKAQLGEVANRIFRDGRKILAILVLIDGTRLIPRFIQEGQLQDLRLPFEKDVLGKLMDLDMVNRFYKKQWMFLSPILNLGTLTENVHGLMALPYTIDKQIGHGSFGTVYEIEVDQEHMETAGAFSGKVRFCSNSFSESANFLKLVRKELRQEDHKFELDVLAILNHLHHPNLLRLLTSYVHVENEYKKKYNLVFPFAEGGTLEDLLVSDRKTTTFTSDEVILPAISGLASALEHMHNFTDTTLDLDLIGFHHDFRPRNVLISGTKFLLADFGLSRFKDAQLSSGTPLRAGGDDYDPPECGNFPGEQTGQIHRLSEVWVFGCILADMLTWMRLGPQGVQDFQARRQFQPKPTSTYSTFHCGCDSPNPEVQRWLHELSSEAPESVKRMVELIRDMLNMKPANRPPSKSNTLSLRIITLLSVSEHIQPMFAYLSTINDTGDVFLEHIKFQAWMSAISNVQFLNRSDRAQNFLTSEKFGSLLQHLHSLREQLRPENMRSGISIKLLIHLIDTLVDALTEDQKQTYRSHFVESLLHLNDARLQAHFKGLTSQGPAPPSPFDKAIRKRRALAFATQIFRERSAKESGYTHIASNSVKVYKAFGQHKLGVIEDGGSEMPVLIEWRSYGRDDSSKEMIQKQLDRVERLTKLLSEDKPEEFCALSCRGFFHNETDCRFGAVFDFPLWIRDPKTARPKTLQSWMDSTDKLSVQPRLEDKFRLATTLATAVVEFHRVGWLHKNISSESVAFFGTKDVPLADSVGQPYIIGLNHCRPGEPSAFSEGIPDSASNYQHPQYRRDQRQYRLEYDYYSLGIVLLEIGLWTTLKNMRIDPKDEFTAEEFTNKIRDSRVSSLLQTMGTRYHDAVRVCISGDFAAAPISAGDHTDAHKKLRLNFVELVVKRLGWPQRAS